MCLVGEKVREKKYFEENNKEEVENIDTLFFEGKFRENLFFSLWEKLWI